MGAFDDFVQYIFKLSRLNDFLLASEKSLEYLEALDDNSFIEIVKEMGIIPECMTHDSSEEKLFSKASDLVLSCCFQKLGLKSKALSERADSADIIAKSDIHRYNLVADAKAFRLSRSAKNQKDFKVVNLSEWRGAENEYAVLVAPYFQFPKTKSQIYAQALDKNVCILSWKHISFMLEKGIKETLNYNLEKIWNSSKMMSRDTRLAFNDRKKCFFPKLNDIICDKIGCSKEELDNRLTEYKANIISRCYDEIAFWENEIDSIKKFSRQKAIDELIKAKKINEKISVIQKYVYILEGEHE